MKISPVINNIYRNNSNAYYNKKSQSPNFTSILADKSPDTADMYNIYLMYSGNEEFLKISETATRIFRELDSELALPKLIDHDKKTKINVLGCSDGSEAWAYAIALKEQMGKKAKNVKITASDIEEPLINVAKSGKIVLSDTEKKYANRTKEQTGISPLKDEGWQKHLILSETPEQYKKELKKHPYLSYMTYDPISYLELGDGLNWYEVNKENLPEVEFEHGNMKDKITSDDDADIEVYVMANSASYVLREEGTDEYISLFKKIKDANQGKNKEVYVVLGKVETLFSNPALHMLYNINGQDTAKITNSIKRMGFNKVDKTTLRKMGVKNPETVSEKIYKLNA